MTLSSQEPSIQSIHNRIQARIAEIAALSNSPLQPQQFAQKFLTLITECLGAQGCALHFYPPQSHPTRLAEINFPSCGANDSPKQLRWIETVLASVQSTARPHIVAPHNPSLPENNPPPGQIGNTVPYPIFYHPIMRAHRVTAILQIWLPAPSDPRDYNPIASIIAQLCSHAEKFFTHWHDSHLASTLEISEKIRHLQTDLIGELSVHSAITTTAIHLLDIAQAHISCALTKKNSRWLLTAASNQESVNPRSAQSLALSSLAQSLPLSPDADTLDITTATPSQKQLLEKCQLRSIVWCHTRSSKNAPLDILLLAARHSGEPLSQQATESTRQVAHLLSKTLDAASLFHHIPLRPLLSPIARWLRACRQNRKRQALLATLPILSLIGALLIPVPWKLTADCRIAPRQKATVVAEISAKVTEVLAREGQYVQANQLLARLDNSDFTALIAMATQQMSRWQVEAAKAQALGNEPDRKIAELNAARERETIRHYQYLNSRTELRAPIPGIILTRNIHNLEGQALEIGQTFCEIASDDAYEILLDIRQPDLGELQAALKSHTPLPVNFILHPIPSIRWQTSLPDSNAISQLPETHNGQSVFIASSPIPDSPSTRQLLKPGFTGKSKIQLGTKPLGWILLRPFWNHVRSRWLF